MKRARLNPALVLVLAFLGVIGVGTVLLSLPIAHAQPHEHRFWNAFFTAWSAVCVNGLSIVDTGTYWSGFGQAVILALIQVGGFGMSTSATLGVLWAGGAMRLRSRLLLQAETRSMSLADARSVAKLIFIVTVCVELGVAAFLTLRFWLGYGMPLGTAAWKGLFHAVSGYCNAGFGLWSDSLSQFVRDPFVLLPTAAAIMIGGLGFPVIHELWVHRGSRKHHYSMHTVLSLWGTVILLSLGTALLLLFEWNNVRTLAPLAVPEKLLASFFTSVAARSVGFNALDTAGMSNDALLLQIFLMFVGAGSAGTGGGVKVTTFFILLVAVWCEVRGHADTHFNGRRVPPAALRQALTILVLSSGVIVLGLFIVMPMADASYERVLFEVVSAGGNVGLSTGLVGELPKPAQFVLMLLMFSGRVGIVTLAVALAARSHRLMVRYPEEKPLVG